MKHKFPKNFVRECNGNKLTKDFLDSCNKLVNYLAKERKRMHKHIEYFNPDAEMPLEQSHQDFSSEMKLFNAGQKY